jgi:WD40 repeat protein
LVFWPDGKTLASASSDQTIRLWDVTTLQPLRTLRGHRLEVFRLALLRDNRTLLSGCKDGSVCVWDTLANSNRGDRIILPGQFVGWQFTPDNRSVLTCDKDGQLTRWFDYDMHEPGSTTVFSLRTNVLRAFFSEDVRWVGAVLTNGVVQVWNCSEQRLVQEFPVLPSTRPISALFLSGDKYFLTAQPDGKSVLAWDLSSLSNVQSWSGFEDPVVGASSPDGKWCLVVNWTGGVSLRDLLTGKVTHPNLNLKQPWGASVSPDGKLFAASSELGYVGLWETSTFRQIAEFRGVLMGYHSVAFSPDGRRLAAGSDGFEAIKLWDPETLQEVFTLEGRGSAFTSVAFSADSNSIGAMNLQGLVHLWRAPSQAEIAASEQGGQ